MTLRSRHLLLNGKSDYLAKQRKQPLGKRLPMLVRFWRKVNRYGPIPVHCPELGPCWIWKAGKDDKGYGRFTVRQNGHRHNLLAHRVARALKLGRMGELNGNHLCDNPPCVNPAHTYEGTQKQNVHDAIARGRRPGSPLRERAGCANFGGNVQKLAPAAPKKFQQERTRPY